MNDIGFSPYIAGVISIDHENSVKVFSAAPSLLGKGHNLFNANGPIWVCHVAWLSYGICNALNRASDPQTTIHISPQVALMGLASQLTCCGLHGGAMWWV